MTKSLERALFKPKENKFLKNIKKITFCQVWLFLMLCYIVYCIVMFFMWLPY